jgi:hypothetical protein
VSCSGDHSTVSGAGARPRLCRVVCRGLELMHFSCRGRIIGEGFMAWHMADPRTMLLLSCGKWPA